MRAGCDRALDVLIDGECAAIHWRMELTLASGQRTTLKRSRSSDGAVREAMTAS
jgi:hypothetical protein